MKMITQYVQRVRTEIIYEEWTFDIDLLPLGLTDAERYQWFKDIGQLQEDATTVELVGETILDID